MANNTGKKYGGRQKGTPNRTTSEVREAIALFVEKNVPRFEEWLDQIAKDNPEKAFQMVQSLLEYHIPKISRVEQQMLDKSGKPTNPSITLSPAEAYRIMVSSE